MIYHRPVLLRESIDGLAITAGGTYVDLTYGGGGHSREILDRLKGGQLFAFDQDQDALKNRIDDKRLVLLNNNFRYLKNFLKYYNKIPVNGILADLGVSSHQIDIPERGFSIRENGILDMRMNKQRSLTAKQILNKYPKEELKRIFKEYGEIKNAEKLANTIVSTRLDREIKGTEQFKLAIRTCVPRGRENKYYAMVFQALRIEINQELEALREMLLQTLEVLKPGGRLVVISYHSLEDRIVKNFMRTGNFQGNIEKDFYGHQIPQYKLVTKKPVVPGEEEITKNPRSRSAKLRIAERI